MTTRSQPDPQPDPDAQARALLVGAGLEVPDDELGAIASGVAGARAMVQLLHRCDVGRAVSGTASR